MAMNSQPCTSNQLIDFALAGNDLLFGESHDMAESTAQTMLNIIESVPSQNIQAIVLELPMEMNEIFATNSPDEITLEDFMMRALALDVESMQETATGMLTSGEITDEQYLHVQNTIHHFARTPLSVLAEHSPIPAFFELSVRASQLGIPVIAADVGRKRIIGALLSDESVQRDLRFDENQLDRIMRDELDDTSDAEYIQSAGVSFSDPRIMLIGRGYAHLDGTVLYGRQDNRRGFDEVLEDAGRTVTTVSVLSQTHSHYVDFSSDPLDIVYDQTNKPTTCM